MSAFDTHKAVKALRQAGFDDAQAKAVVDQISGAITETLASKADLDRTERTLAATIESRATREELRAAKEELWAAIALLATKEELRAAIAPLTTKEELARLELRMTVRMEELTGKMLKYMGGGLALVVALIKGLDLLTG